jgi:hypothetical protein
VDFYLDSALIFIHRSCDGLAVLAQLS